MKTPYHILNGDALREQFPKEIDGELIVMRECLVEGDVNGDDLAQFLQTRARFISQNFTKSNEQDYYEKTVAEFEKIRAIPKNTEICLWFEDDLFCQVNFWFVVSLLHTTHPEKLSLVRPLKHSFYGFGGLNKGELIDIYHNRKPLTKIAKINELWQSYKQNDTDNLLLIANELKTSYPFILPAVNAHVERFPVGEKLGRPKETLLSIMKELKTDEFSPVFKEFCKREPIYGFGDSQVKRLFDEIKKHIQ